MKRASPTQGGRWLAQTNYDPLVTHHTTENISAACADRQSSVCLASQYTRRFCARGDDMPPCCLAMSRWGAARRRLDTGIALPPAWSYEESTSWHDENKVIITETPNVTMSWTLMIDHCCTMISLKRVHSCNDHFHFWTKKQCKKWFGPRVGLVLSRVEKLSYVKKKVFLILKLLLWKISH